MSTNHLNVCLVGKTGTGKSATGNSLLGRQAFESEPSTTSVTSKVSVHTSEVGGRKVTVVDGPGVGDTEIDDEEAIKQSIHHMDEVMAACPEGYHALLLMFRYGTRYTAEDRKSLATLKVLLGEDFVRKHAILVVTCGDNLVQELGAKTGGEKNQSTLFSHWLSKQIGDLALLVGELQGRAVLFDNMTDDPTTLASQRDEFFEAVDQISNPGRRYTLDHFLASSDTRQKALVEVTLERVTAETEEKLQKISSQMTSIMNRSQESANEISSKLGLLKELSSQIITVRQDIEVQDKSTGALGTVKEMVESKSNAITFALQVLKVALEQKNQQDKIEEDIRRSQREFERQQAEAKRKQEKEEKEKRMRHSLELFIDNVTARQRELKIKIQLEEFEEKKRKLERELEWRSIKESFTRDSLIKPRKIRECEWKDCLGPPDRYVCSIQ